MRLEALLLGLGLVSSARFGSVASVEENNAFSTLLQWMPTIQEMMKSGLHQYQPLLELFRMRRHDLSRLSLDLIVYSADQYAKKHFGDGKEENKSLKQMVSEMGWLETLSRLLAESRRRSEELKSAVLSPELPQSVIDGLASRTGTTTSCVQLFLCKMSPVVWAMQLSANDTELDLARSAGSNWERFWDRLSVELPGGSDLVSFGKQCDAKFPTCPLINFRDDNRLGN